MCIRDSLNGSLDALSLEEPAASKVSQPVITNKYKAIIIAKPDSAFAKDEKDKFIIDQFIMRGGKVLLLIDPVYATMDLSLIHI